MREREREREYLHTQRFCFCSRMQCHISHVTLTVKLTQFTYTAANFASITLECLMTITCWFSFNNTAVTIIQAKFGTNTLLTSKTCVTIITRTCCTSSLVVRGARSMYTVIKTDFSFTSEDKENYITYNLLKVQQILNLIVNKQ